MNSDKPSIKCIALDLDGTLVSFHPFYSNYISKENIKALKEFCSNGKNKIVLSTGRNVEDTWEIYKTLSEKGIDVPYLVCMNGALVVDTKKPHNVIFSGCIQEDTCKRIVEYLKTKGFNYFLVTEDREVIHPLNPYSFFIYFIWFRKKYGKRNLRHNPDLSRIQRILIVTKLPKYKEINRYFKGHFGDLCYVSKCWTNCVEIVSNQIDKFYGLQKVAQKLGLEIDNFAAMGNGQNDIVSLENVGFGVGINLEISREEIVYNKKRIDLELYDSTGEGVAQAVYEMKKRELW